MRHLLSPKVALLAPLLLVFALLPAPSAHADDSVTSSFFAEVSGIFNDVLAAILASADDQEAAPQILPHGASAPAHVDENEASPHILVNG